MKSTNVILAFLAFLLLVPSAHADIAEGGTGMLFGTDHAFYFTAPNGWVLDNQSGVSRGLHMVFYPIGYTWANSPVVAYGRSVSKNSTAKSVKDQVERTIKEFHTHYESPNYRGEKQSILELPDGIRIQIYFFRGDKWGNYEAVGYIEEESTINLLVYNSRTKEDFYKYLHAFEKILFSYKNVYRDPEPIDDEEFNRLVQEAKRISSTQKGKAYETQIVKSSGQAMANFMRSCTSYTSAEEMQNFDIVFRVEPNGEVSEAFIRPETTLSRCFMGLVLNSKQPPHELESYLQHIDMRVKE